MIGGVATTGGDLVFIGEITGDFLALDAKDGKVLFEGRAVNKSRAGRFITDAVHKAGHLIFLQLWHVGRNSIRHCSLTACSGRALGHQA